MTDADGPPYFMDAECYECGQTIEMLQPKCSECADPMPEPDELARERVFRESDLRELADKWRNETEEGEYRYHYANELEEWIADE